MPPDKSDINNRLNKLALISMEASKLKGQLIVGTRIPHEFFVVQGSGESDLGYHPGAYDIALEKAGGIHNFNHIIYSSILPKTAIRITKVPENYPPGSVLESITAESGKGMEYPKRLTSGIIITKIFKNGDCIGGLVAEYNGTDTKEVCQKFLKANMNDMVNRRYGDNVQTQDELFVESIEPKSKHACALVVLGFTSYKYPVFGIEKT